MPFGFRQWFDHVTAYYGCTSDEKKLMVQIVRKDPDSAATCFLAIYTMLTKHLELGKGINEAIRADIAKQRALEEKQSVNK